MIALAVEAVMAAQLAVAATAKISGHRDLSQRFAGVFRAFLWLLVFFEIGLAVALCTTLTSPTDTLVVGSTFYVCGAGYKAFLLTRPQERTCACAHPPRPVGAPDIVANLVIAAGGVIATVLGPPDDGSGHLILSLLLAVYFLAWSRVFLLGLRTRRRFLAQLALQPSNLDASANAGG